MKTASLVLLLITSTLLLTACDTSKEVPPTNKSGEPEPAPVATESAAEATEPAPAATESEITLVASCSGCHGRDGVNARPGVPFIAGQPAKYLVEAMRGYLIGDRKHNVMRTAVFDLEVDERQQLAEHFAGLTTPWKRGAEGGQVTGGRPGARAIRAGKNLSRQCAGCHGSDGNSIKAGIPSLAGLQPSYFVPSLKSYLSGARRGAAIMKNFKLSLSQEDIQNLAAYFAVQQRKQSKLDATAQQAGKPPQSLLTRCVGCHGAEGNSINPDMPSLAGQNSAYLLKAMQHYRDGERHEPMMQAVAKGHSDATLEKLASYFATRKPSASAMTKVSTKTPAGHFDPLGDGKNIAASCNACHGDKGNSTLPGTPRLSGQHDTYLRGAIAAYQGDHRKHVMMRTLTKHLSQTDIEKVSLYYASQTPAPDAAKVDAKKVAQGKELASGCAGCHGEDGNSQDKAIPSLAGQNSAYLMAAIKAYKDKLRDNSDMQGAVEELDAKAIKALAQYYAQLAPKAGPVHTMEAPEVLAQKCNRCHGEDGRHPDTDTKPRIAGQRQSYMVKALLAYKTGERPSNLMDAMAGDLSLTEIKAIAAYYAHK